jgi:hypothetical protein
MLWVLAVAPGTSLGSLPTRSSSPPGGPAPLGAELRAAADPNLLNYSPVLFSVNAGLNGTFVITLGFNAYIGVTGRSIDAGTSLNGLTGLEAVPEANLSVAAGVGLSRSIPVPTLGQFGPVTIPGATISPFGVPLDIQVQTTASIQGMLNLSGPGENGVPIVFTWEHAGNLSFPVAPPQDAAGRTVYANVTDLTYALSVGLDAVGTIPGTGIPINYTLAPLTPIGSVLGVPSNLSAAWPVVAPPSIRTFTAKPSPLPIGSITQLNVTPVGGSGSLSYTYAPLPPGCATEDTAHLSCQPSATGHYSVGVTVTDSQGFNASASTMITVTASPSASEGGSGLPGFLLPVLAGAVAVAVVGSLLLVRRRRKKAPPAAEEADAP